MAKTKTPLHDEAGPGMSATVQRVLPWVVVGVLALWLLAAAARSGGGGGGLGAYDYHAFGALPVSENGRVKPLDTLARNALLQISGKQTLVEEMLLPGEGEDSLPAVIWLAEVFGNVPGAQARPVFRIDDPDVLGLLGKTPEDGKYFSLNDLFAPQGEDAHGRPVTGFHRIAEQAQLADRKDPAERSRFEEHVLGLHGNIRLVDGLASGMRPYMLPPTVKGEEWQPLAEAGTGAQRASITRAAGQRATAKSWAEMVGAYHDGDVEEFNRRVSAHFDAVQSAQQSVAASGAGRSGAVFWVALVLGVLMLAGTVGAVFWGRSRSAGATRGWVKWLVMAGLLVFLIDMAFLAVSASGSDDAGYLRKATFEQGFNVYRPFVKSMVLYLLAGIVGLLGLQLRSMLSPAWYKTIWRSGVGVLMLALLLHTAGLLIRMWLQGRPPVTNLYSSAVFIGWAVVCFAVVMELISRLGIASLASSIVGVATLFIAHNLAKDGDTMGVMQAVLDSNFWLGTHVVTVTLGYAATFFAGFLAFLYIVLGMATPVLDRKSARLLTGMVYSTLCFALLFSFVGTVLGGIWADQSWGRFWGWDPKENGAVMIVLMNAITLHARWGHLVRERGIMALAMFGNIITAWSWFGTNLLGVGLHSYGFMDGAMVKLLLFAAANLVVIAVALAVPTRYWLSFQLNKPEREPRSNDAASVG